MLSFRFLALLFSTATTPYVGQLSLRLSGASSFSDPYSGVVSTTLTNVGTTQLTLLNHPNTILSDMQTDSFDIVNEHGVAPAFTGVVVKYVPKVATSFTSLAPGESVMIHHSLSNTYDFVQSGAGVYRIQPSSVDFLVQSAHGFEHVVADTIPHFVHVTPEYISSCYVDIKTHGHHESIFDNQVLMSDGRTASDGPQFIGCTPQQEKNINRAAVIAHVYAEKAHEYLTTISGETKRYTTWFGEYDLENHQSVTSHFARAALFNFSTATYDCTCEEDTFANTDRDVPGVTRLCKAFWTAPLSGWDSQAGALVHESTHWTAIAGTWDYAKGIVESLNLAKTSSYIATVNADSHEYFAESHLALP